MFKKIISILIFIFFSFVYNSVNAWLVPWTISVWSWWGAGVCTSQPCDYVYKTCSTTTCDTNWLNCTTTNYNCSYYASTCYYWWTKTYNFWSWGGKIWNDSSISCTVNSWGTKNVWCTYSNTNSYFITPPNQLWSKSVWNTYWSNNSCSLVWRVSTVDNIAPTITINDIWDTFDSDEDHWCNMEKYLRDDYWTSSNPLLPWCEYYKATNWECWSSNWNTFQNAPTTWLCNSWNSSSVITSTTYNWTCSWTHWWSTTNCSAFKAATCNDWIKNWSETWVDCWWSCWSCLYKVICKSPSWRSPYAYCNWSDIRLSCIDTWNWNNHWINLLNPNWCQAYEWSNNKWSEWCYINCQKN